MKVHPVTLDAYTCAFCISSYVDSLLEGCHTELATLTYAGLTILIPDFFTPLPSYYVIIYRWLICVHSLFKSLCFLSFYLECLFQTSLDLFYLFLDTFALAFLGWLFLFLMSDIELKI